MSDTMTVPAPTAAAADVEDAPHAKGLGIAAWLSIGWLVFIMLVALTADFLPLEQPDDWMATVATRHSTITHAAPRHATTPGPGPGRC